MLLNWTLFVAFNLFAGEIKDLISCLRTSYSTPHEIIKALDRSSFELNGKILTMKARDTDSNDQIAFFVYDGDDIVYEVSTNLDSNWNFYNGRIFPRVTDRKPYKGIGTVVYSMYRKLARPGTKITIKSTNNETNRKVMKLYLKAKRKGLPENCDDHCARLIYEKRINEGIGTLDALWINLLKKSGWPFEVHGVTSQLVHQALPLEWPF